jgi:competence protein ComEA
MKSIRITRFFAVSVLGLALAFPAAAADSSTKKTKADAPKAETSRSTKMEKVDINTADLATLELLPGVGPQTAKAIVAARPFSSVAQLEEVSGIGPEKMRDLKPLVTASRSSVAKKDAAATASKPVATTSSAATRKSSKSDGSPAASASEGSTARRTPAERPLEPTGRSTTKANPDSAQRLVNLNTATRAELEALPDIGPVKAQAIIDARPFSSIEDVMRVKGIKEGTFESIRGQITVR